MKKVLKMTELKKLLKKKIDDFEYYNSGMKWANGGFAEVKKLSVEKERDDDDKVIGYVVHASVLIGDCEQETLYRDCEYHFDMELKLMMISDLDGFVQWLENEMSAKRISKFKGKKVIEAIDVVENAIEEFQY